MIEALVRKHFKDFQPYRSARSESAGAAGGLHPAVLLDANELSMGSPVSFDGLPLNRYPDPLQQELRSRLAARAGVSRDQIFLGVGSDEIIDLLIRLFCEPVTDRVVVLEPTYGVYRVAANMNAVGVVEAQLDREFQIGADTAMRAQASGAKLLFCCSPNNPTGNLLRSGDILRLCENFGGVVVVDEAYIDFTDDDSSARDPALLQKRVKSENLVILRTMSKAWGLAGIRLGYCVAHASLISYLLRIKSPYNINSVTARIALQALEKEAFLRWSVRSIIEERERLRRLLGDLENVLRVYPSAANFLLVEFKDSARAFDHLLEAGIVVRRRAEPRLKNCLRITVGTPEENSLLVRTLQGLT